MDVFESLKRQRPKDFWSFFRKKKQSHGANIAEDFQKYFSSMFTDIRTTINEKVEHLNENSDFNTKNPTFYELNAPITIAEVEYAIKQLNKNKASCPCDNLLNEYFIESFDILGAHITDMFYKIFSAGFFPQSWSLGYIVPIYKKGDKNDSNNYRGITLLSNFGKCLVAF